MCLLTDITEMVIIVLFQACLAGTLVFVNAHANFHPPSWVTLCKIKKMVIYPKGNHTVNKLKTRQTTFSESFILFLLGCIYWWYRNCMSVSKDQHQTDVSGCIRVYCLALERHLCCMFHVFVLIVLLRDVSVCMCFTHCFASVVFGWL